MKRLQNGLQHSVVSFISQSRKVRIQNYRLFLCTVQDGYGAVQSNTAIHDTVRVQ
jgi:hypothetical protein